MARFWNRCVINALRVLGWLPLPLLRALGWVLGWGLYLGVAPRRRVVMVNLGLCFGQLSPVQRRRLARRVFVRFAQAWLDRGWLWFGPEALLRRRLHIAGDTARLHTDQPLVLFAPHFMGLDAGWTALTLNYPRRFVTIYTDQSNADMDAWILAGRQRWGNNGLYGRADGVKQLLADVRQGAALYLLPDMNFGPHESVFVPFYGVPAATVPSLSRFARLTRAPVQPVITRLSPRGYTVQVLPAWSDFPTADASADTVLMNLRLQTYIDAMPEQYYWVHKRFKDRPDNGSDVYIKN
ncbi:MAG: lysophospholipid acyltransferase family protein [Rhodoferax sp.]